MGWGRGTEIFDQVAEDLLAHENGWVKDYIIEILTNLNTQLSDLDWDTECESKYWDHPVIGKILGNPFDEEEYND